MWKWLRDKTLRQNVLGQESELEELRETSYDGNKVSSTLIKKKAIPTQLVVKSQQPTGFSVTS